MVLPGAASVPVAFFACGAMDTVSPGRMIWGSLAGEYAPDRGRPAREGFDPQGCVLPGSAAYRGKNQTRIALRCERAAVRAPQFR